MAFARVETLEDLDSLNEEDVHEGYCAAERGDPEPGENRGRAYWHGWCNRQRDRGLLPTDAISIALAHQWVERKRKEAALSLTGPNAILPLG